ncbi:hypothetical protein BKH46_02740 [Helicobacter sp. 12S02634-8]|uniref:dihydroneopterin aldolase n=1 Tax=Helicobacter sp. 12S02634-8 TaxID=1476199 RepID=UPI000BA732AF|nr:dihydroneopterin aldolase [Helicobacter sp. 12S02634-8]PAF47773.1 hypothetical protein BKH46_02740 [Helicobacter sp. 12S02634-8]
MDTFTLIIEDLELEAVIGILDFERVRSQRLIVQGAITYCYEGKNFIDYISVKEKIKSLLQTKQYGLLEEALEDITQTLKQKFDTIISICMTIKKPQISDDCSIGVRIDKTF